MVQNGSRKGVTIIIPGLLPHLLPINFLERISPSQFPIYKKCILGAVWASSSDIDPLLPKPPYDEKGKVIEKKKLGNGLVLLKLIPKSEKSKIIKVKGIHLDRHPALYGDIKEIAIFSMKSSNLVDSYSEGPLTTIYMPQEDD